MECLHKFHIYVLSRFEIFSCPYYKRNWHVLEEIQRTLGNAFAVSQGISDVTVKV